jgi:hypothetical protein
MKMKAKITVETKKGVTHETTWKITQSHPYPDIERGQWRNGDGFFPTWRGGMSNGEMVADGIGLKFYCALLRSDLVKEEGNRADHAGYTPYYYSKTLPANPGTITFRGRDLGEMEFTIDLNSQYVNMQGRTDGEREFIAAQIVPALRAAIEANKVELRAAALSGLESSLAERIAAMRADADKLEKEAAAALAVEKARKV